MSIIPDHILHQARLERVDDGLGGRLGRVESMLRINIPSDDVWKQMSELARGRANHLRGSNACQNASTTSVRGGRRHPSFSNKPPLRV